MKVGIAALVAGVVGSIGVLCFLTAFGTDYWLLASENCTADEHMQPETSTSGLANNKENQTVKVENNLSEIRFHHEGFFWRCWFTEDVSHDSIWNFLFTNQPPSKYCVHGYLFPLPISIGPVPHPSYDAAAVFRGFWTAFIVLAVTASLVGGFLLVCAVPFMSAKLYKLGGGFLITAGGLFTVLIALFVLWKELVADMNKYILLERSLICLDTEVYVQYGWSFMFAAAGIPLVLLSGLLFYFIGRHNQRNK
ncbi:transmembrane protein 182-like [Huso huso]|uniref:Transmembrane protein 182-like n=1 Tax=Huso huso TaxID=61971 RepID=A0ABR0Z6B9_HUSHU